MAIRILSPDVASKIAAGEVIERPASVVKELVENSLDAGASQIAVEAVGGGVQMLRVVDNGTGIPPEEVELAFERFATSKVSGISDLDSINSLGFRGEALPSIAAVAEVTMVTRTADELSGVFLNLKGGAIVERTRRGCPVGTTVTVRSLFRDFPARLKFLKSTATENGHISNLVGQYSLAYPAVKFMVVLDGKTAFRSPGSGDLREALAAVYGADTARSLLEIKADDSNKSPIIQVSGFTSPPSLTRSSRSYQSFFVNRRWVQSRMLPFALEEAYKGLLMTGRHPLAVVDIRLPPQEIDVNVHPTKNEVRFRHERDVFAALHKVVSDTLLAQAPIPRLETIAPPPETEPAEAIPLMVAGQAEVAPEPKATPIAAPPARSLPVLRVIGQVANTYIVAEGPQGMYLIDQHAAHERVLFDKIRAERQRQAIEVQGLLQPAPVELTAQQQELLESQMEALAQYGFSIERFGERTYLIRSLPALLKNKNAAQVFIEVLDTVAGEDPNNDWQERIAASLACHGAALAGQALSIDEMRELVLRLERTAQPRTCPHGRPTMIHLSASQLEKGFGRK